MSALLSVEAAAVELAVHPGSLRRWIYQGRVPAVHLGRAVRIRRRDLDALIAANLRPAHPDLALPGVEPDATGDAE